MTSATLHGGEAATYALPEVDPRDEAILALFGHDLRAALSDVIGGLRLIAPEALDPGARVQFDRVQASGEALARMLEQGLSVLLGETGPVPMQDIHLRRFFSDIDLRWSGRAQELRRRFVIRLQDGLPAMIRVDRVALDRVLSNLLGNAFKYGGGGQVVCDVALQAGGGLRIAVRDTGPGFPAAMLAHQLPFHRRPSGMTKPGSGMGLHIAADLVHQMGGSMTLLNLDPAGAEVRVELPLMQVAEPKVHSSVPLPVLSGKRVLIADDNPTCQTILSRLANGLGAETIVVEDGVQAMGRLEREAFDLLIVDIEMPRLNGLDVIRCLRALPGAAARMPVIVVTAGMPRPIQLAVQDAGGQEVLSKLLMDTEAFLAVVKTATAGAELPRVRLSEVGPTDTGSTVTGPTEPGPTDTAADLEVPMMMDESRLDRLLELAGPEVGQDLLDRLLIDLAAVEGGLVQAGATIDWTVIRNQTHVLISLAGAVGGLRLQAEAEALNQLAHRGDIVRLSGQMSRVMTLLDRLLQHIAQVRDRHAAACP